MKKLTLPAFWPADLYTLRLLATASGEHIPLLVDGRTGLPLNRPNQYMLAVRRDRCQVSPMMKEQSVLCIVLASAVHVGIELYGLLAARRIRDPSLLGNDVDHFDTQIGPPARVPFASLGCEGGEEYPVEI